MKKPTQQNVDERFGPYYAIGEAIAVLLHPHAEVVLHDLKSGKIVRLWNAFTSRKAGDPSYLEGASDLFTEERVLGPYEKALPSQGRTKSITAALYDAEGMITGYFCVNLNVTMIDGIVSQLQDFVRTASERPKPMYLHDFQQQVNYAVRDYLLEINKTIDGLTRQERVELVARIDAEGLFQARNAVRFVATAFSISRASVYNLLAEAQAQGSVEKRARVSTALRKSRLAQASLIADAQTQISRPSRPSRQQKKASTTNV